MLNCYNDRFFIFKEQRERETKDTESDKNVILRQTSEKEVEKNKANKTAQNRKIRSRLKCKNHNIIKQKQSITLNE